MSLFVVVCVCFFEGGVVGVFCLFVLCAVLFMCLYVFVLTWFVGVFFVVPVNCACACVSLVFGCMLCFNGVVRRSFG